MGVVWPGEKLLRNTGLVYPGFVPFADGGKAARRATGLERQAEGFEKPKCEGPVVFTAWRAA